MAENNVNETPVKEPGVSMEAPKMLNGREVDDIKIRCSRHGDISQGSIYLRYSTIQESTKTIINNNNLMCMCCLNELYTKLQETPKTRTQISYKKDDNGKLVLDEYGNPIQIVEKQVIYMKDKEGNFILDENGNPVPEYEIGTTTVDVVYKEEPKTGDEVKNEKAE